MMRAHVNNFVLLLRSPVYTSTTVQKHLPVFARRLHSDVASVAAVKAAQTPVAEPRPPLTDLLGRRHNYLRISLTERCNLRCQYCMPIEGVPLSPRDSLLTRDELSRSVRLFASLGVDKVRLTGGEPTLRKDLADIIQDISSIDGIKSVAITTNGLVLTRRLVSFQRAGLTALNVSLDSLRPERYEAMARRPGLSRVLAGIDLALQLGYRPVKINVVLMKGFNDDEIADFVEYTRDREVEVRFIEFMPFTGNAWDDSKLVPHKDAVRTLSDAFPDVMPMLPRPNDTARVYKVPGYAGSVGFISSMTKNFCSSCNRLRLTADGNLKVCLFGASEVSVRDALRGGADDDELEQLVRTALYNKKPQHAVTAGSSLLPGAVDLLWGTTAAFLRTSTNETAKASTYLKTSGFQKTPESLSGLTALNNTLAAKILPSSFLSRKPTTNIRFFSSKSDSPKLTHVDDQGRARMVDVGDKEITVRTAQAICSIRVSPHVLRLLRTARLAKGDALAAAQLAGVLAAKRTADLIPLCHPLPLDCVNVTVELPKDDVGEINIRSSVRVTARTGAEMEALTGAAVAALTLYDMCKSADRCMRIGNLRVVSKTGGRSGDWPRPAEPEPKVRDLDTTPLNSDETYVPTNVMHF